MKQPLAATALLALAISAGASTGVRAQSDTLFLSTQLRPVEEATQFRSLVLNNAPQKVTYAVEEPAAFTVRVDAETKAGKRTVSLLGALASFGAQMRAGVLDPGMTVFIVAVIALLLWLSRRELAAGRYG